MPDKITELCWFYTDQYGMRFRTVYDAMHRVLKGHIVFRNTEKNFSIMCVGLSDKEIVAQFHLIIYDVLIEEGRNIT